LVYVVDVYIYYSLFGETSNTYPIHCKSQQAPKVKVFVSVKLIVRFSITVIYD